MKKHILIELRAAVCVDEFKHGNDYMKDRINDYVIGLNSFFNQLDRSKDCDVVFVENICEGPEDLPQEVQNAIPEGTFMYVKKKNDYGKYNKGGGDIELWKDYLEQICEYEYFFHYEPRMRLDDPAFLQSFLETPRNLFCLEDNPHVPTVKTGYFGVKVSDFKEYVEGIDLDKFVGESTSIEQSMRSFFETKVTDFEPDVKYCTRRWYNEGYGSGYSKY